MSSDLLGAAVGLIGKGVDFGAAYGGSQLQAEITRKLRRTAYQDQMYSMREAGLNPILAAGASPGTSSAQPITSQPTDLTSGAESFRRSEKLSREKELLSSQQKQADALARKAEAEATTAEAIRDAKVRGETADADFKEGSLDSRVGRERTLYEIGANRSRLTRREVDLDLPRILAEQRQAEAGLTAAREIGQSARNVPDLVEAQRLGNEYFRVLRNAGATAADASAAVAPLIRALVGARTGGRSRGTSARSPGDISGKKIPGSARDQVRADHPRRYSKDEFGNFVDKHTGEVLKDAP